MELYYGFGIGRPFLYLPRDLLKHFPGVIEEKFNPLTV